MENIYLLLVICLVFWYFIYLRKIGESAQRQAQSYCQKHDLQYLALARESSRLKFSRTGGFYLLSRFNFEFSGDGESSNQGTLVLRGLKLFDVEMPVYRIH